MIRTVNFTNVGTNVGTNVAVVATAAAYQTRDHSHFISLWHVMMVFDCSSKNAAHSGRSWRRSSAVISVYCRMRSSTLVARSRLQ